MSASVGTMRAGSNKNSGSKEKSTKNEKNTTHQQQQQQQPPTKSDNQASKMQPTQEQIRLAQMMNSNQSDADPNTVKELMELTGKSEDVVVIALHDAENDADRAVMILLDGGEEQQGEWREQSGKKKKKGSSQKENHDDIFDSKPKDRGDRDDKDGSDRNDLPPRRGGRRNNGGPPPRLARGRGRDRGNFGDRDRDRDNRNSAEDWDNERGDRGGADRGRSRGRGGFSGRRSGGGGAGGGRGRFNSSSDRDNRSFNRHVPRFEKMNNSQPIDGPEIDTWTNETAETNTGSKDTDWNNWNDSWVNEEDQWTGTLDETKVFTPSMKMPESEPVINEPPSSLGQRLDVGSLFIESAKFSKAPDYSKPTGDAYINQFNQAATESIKNSIGIGSSSRTPQSMSSLMTSQQTGTNSLGLSSLTQGSNQSGVGVLSSLPQQGPQSAMAQLNQISQSASQAMSQIGQVGRDQGPPSQSRISSVMQQQQQSMVGQQQSMVGQQDMGSSLQQRPKPQRSKMPPPSKIPASAVEMPGHIPRNTQLDVQFGIDFGAESNTSFGFGVDTDNSAEPGSYSSTTNGGTSVISNHLSQAHTSTPSGETSNNNIGSSLISSPSTGSNKVPSSMDSRSTVFNSVYTASTPKNEPQSLDRDQSNMTGGDTMSFSSSQMERKTSPMMPQRPGQPTQNLNSGSLPLSKNDTSSSNYSSTNGYSSPYQNHQKSSAISQTQTFSHTQSSQPQGSAFQGQYPASQPGYPASGQNQFSAPPGSSQFPPPGQPPQFNNAQNQYSSGLASTGTSAAMPHMNHQSQYSAGSQSSYSTGAPSQYSGYQNNSSFPSHPQSQANFSSANQSGGPASSLYPVSTQSSGSSYTQQPNTYQSPSAGSYHSRDNQTNAPASTQSSTGVIFPTPPQATSLKPSTSQTNSNFSSQSFNSTAAPLQPSSLANKLGESLSKMTLKDTTGVDGHQPSQYDSNTPTTLASTSLSLQSTNAASLSTGTTTISSTSTVTSITSTSRIATMPSTSKAPPNLPPGVPLMGQYIMGQSTMPPFYSVQPPVYGYEEMQLLQQRMPLQTGSYYDMSAFPAPAGSTLPTGREQQPPIPNVPFTGTSADTSKVPRVDAQSPNSSSQPQNAHSTAQPLFNFHYGYIYPSMFPGAAGLQYPMFPIPPVTNAAAHQGTTATTQFQKNYSHVYTTKGYDELNQAQDFSKTGYGSSPNTGKTSGTRSGASEITPNAYNKSHTQTFDKQGFHGSTPPPFNLPLGAASQAGPMGAPNTPYAPFLPVMAAHQAHSQMMPHPMQQDSNSSSSRSLNQTAAQAKAGGGKSYGAPTYWNN